MTATRRSHNRDQHITAEAERESEGEHRRAELYLHAEVLQSTIDEVRKAALVLSRHGKDRNIDDISNLAGGLLSIHSRLSTHFAALVSILRTYPDEKS